ATAITGAHAADRELIAMRAKVTLHDDARPGAPTRVEVRTTTAVHCAEQDVSTPERDLTRQARRLAGKFRALATPALGSHAAEQLLTSLLRLEPASRVSELMARTRPAVDRTRAPGRAPSAP